MQEETDSDFVHLEGFGKRQGFANEAAQTLAKGIVETLNAICGATLGVVGVMLVGGQDVVVALQVIGIKQTLAVSQRDAIPKGPGGRIIARTQRVGNDLASASAQGQPRPDHATPPVAHEAPQFIQFQHVLRLGRSQRGRQRRQILGFF